MPFLIDRFTLLGRYRDIGTLGSARWEQSEVDARIAERPGPNTVIRFGRERD